MVGDALPPIAMTSTTTTTMSPSTTASPHRAPDRERRAGSTPSSYDETGRAQGAAAADDPFHRPAVVELTIASRQGDARSGAAHRGRCIGITAILHADPRALVSADSRTVLRGFARP